MCVRVIMQEALGVVRCGQVAGLLGPSGGGKSTLLEMLAGHKTLGNLSGSIGLLPSCANSKTTHQQHSRPSQGSMAVGHTQGQRADQVADAGVAPGNTPHVAMNQHSITQTRQSQELPEAGGNGANDGPNSSITWRTPQQHATAVKAFSAFVPQVGPSLMEGSNSLLVEPVKDSSCCCSAYFVLRMLCARCLTNVA
jgi:ATPase subunit of ABC transporter with duplicated ATPase domains